MQNDVLEEFRKKFELNFKNQKFIKKNIGQFRGGFLFYCHNCNITHVFLEGSEFTNRCTCREKLISINAPNFSISFSQR